MILIRTLGIILGCLGIYGLLSGKVWDKKNIFFRRSHEQISYWLTIISYLGFAYFALFYF